MGRLRDPLPRQPRVNPAEAGRLGLGEPGLNPGEDAGELGLRGHPFGHVALEARGEELVLVRRQRAAFLDAQPAPDGVPVLGGDGRGLRVARDVAEDVEPAVAQLVNQRGRIGILPKDDPADAVADDDGGPGGGPGGRAGLAWNGPGRAIAGRGSLV